MNRLPLNKCPRCGGLLVEVSFHTETRVEHRRIKQDGKASLPIRSKATIESYDSRQGIECERCRWKKEEDEDEKK